MSRRLFAVAILLCLSSLPAIAAGIFSTGNIMIMVDENCNGMIFSPFGTGNLPCGFQNDPGPGGLPGAMTYDMLNPPGLVVGDVLLTDGITGVEDVIRFNPFGGPGNPRGLGSLVFYSDGTTGIDSGADTLQAPSDDYPNSIFVPEVQAPDGWDYVVYIPTSSDPGYVAGSELPVTYFIISDTPEPGTILLAGLGALALIQARRRRG